MGGTGRRLGKTFFLQCQRRHPKLPKIPTYLPEVERIDLENAASPEEADELEEMTADEMAVDGYYVVAGIARHEYKQGWKFLTLWDGYGLSEATWEPMSGFIQPDGSINPIFRTYLVENNEGQLLTRAETMSQRKKRN